MPESAVDPVVSARQRVNQLRRWRSDDDPVVVDAERSHNVLSLEEHIRRVVDAAPPLTEDQRTRLAGLLRGGGAA